VSRGIAPERRAEPRGRRRRNRVCPETEKLSPVANSRSVTTKNLPKKPVAWPRASFCVGTFAVPPGIGAGIGGPPHGAAPTIGQGPMRASGPTARGLWAKTAGATLAVTRPFFAEPLPRPPYFMGKRTPFPRLDPASPFPYNKAVKGQTFPIPCRKERDRCEGNPHPQRSP